ncbi:DUF222 domain-containing protein [Rhodococcus sp. IEGM 1370]|nr:DUF222 domain-containing protein [Rhodococcus sp. IEGM 1370]MDV8076787.1 DUF222 domain-containing protein [Rhodococcus sp. IEGM 1370]
MGRFDQSIFGTTELGLTNFAFRRTIERTFYFESEHVPGGDYTVITSSSTRSRFAAYLGPQPKPYIDSTVLGEIRDVAILENQACARKVALAAAIWDSCIHQNVLVGDVIQDAGNYAASEVARVLGCSKTVANTYAEVGMDLRLRLPTVAAAFEAGELDLARVRAIYRCTHNLTQDAATAVQGEVLHAARRLSPGPLVPWRRKSGRSCTASRPSKPPLCVRTWNGTRTSRTPTKMCCRR